jgi:hypothetical protein
MNKLSWIATAVLVLAPTAVFADTLTLISPPPGPYYGPYYIAPYYLQLNQQNNGPILALTCIDPLRDISKGLTWDVNIVDKTSDPDFQRLGWLITQYDSTNGAAIQWAIWDIVSPGFAPSHLGSNDPLLTNNPLVPFSIAYWKNASLGKTVGGASLTYYEPDGDVGQGFLEVQVPEPSLILLIAIGIFAVSFAVFVHGKS